MELHFPAELETRLTRLADLQGRDRASLVVEAVERLLGYDEWFLARVDEGLAQVDAGRSLSHEAVGVRLDTYLAGKLAAK